MKGVYLINGDSPGTVGILWKQVSCRRIYWAMS